jgi:hypothetical protein
MGMIVGWRRTDGVNDLVNHDFTELKLLVLFAVSNVLRNHGDTVVVIAKALAPTVRMASFLIIVVIKRTDASALADATVAHSASLIVLVAEVKRLEE